MDPYFFDVKKNNFPGASDFEKPTEWRCGKYFLDENFQNNVPDVPNVPVFDLSEAVDAEEEKITGCNHF